MSHTSFSIIIPVYNGGQFIKECIDSVLAQSYPASQILVVDDGSTDDTPHILHKYLDKIEVISQDNSGQGAARNKALGYVKHDYVLFLDADDKLQSSTLQSLAQSVGSDSDVDIVHFNWQYFAAGLDGREEYTVKDFDDILHVGKLTHEDCDKLLTISNYFAINNAFRAKFLREKNIKFSEGVIYEDNMMMVKAITRANKIHIINKPLYLYRRSNQQSSSRSGYTSDRHYRDSIKAIKDSISVLNSRTSFTGYYLLDYYLQKITVYYEKRIPKKYKNQFIKDAIDALSKLQIDELPASPTKFVMAVTKFQLVTAKRYLLVRFLIIIKVTISRLRKLQE